MKRNCMRLLPVAAICAALTMGACSGKGKTEKADTTDALTDALTAEAGTPAPAITTDTVHWTDTLAVGGCKAVAAITGQYPSGGALPLLDSVRTWLGERLSYGMWDTGTPMFTADASDLASGNKIAARCGENIMAMAKKDFTGFVQDSISVNYEFYYKFAPVYMTDNVLTYSFSGYAYLGGAHGGALANDQSFLCSNGERLTAENIFVPEKRKALMNLIRDGLWNQYFKPEAGSDGTLRDALLINPDTLPLPACPPEYRKEGLVFTYQQYEIACYAAGMPQCTLPYEQVEPLMTKTGLSALGK